MRELLRLRVSVGRDEEPPHLGWHLQVRRTDRPGQSLRLWTPGLIDLARFAPSVLRFARRWPELVRQP